MKELQPGIFNNLLRLCLLDLHHNQISILQPGTFNNLLNLNMLCLNNNKIGRLQSKSYYGLSISVNVV